jgi:hypothetical protein
MQLTQKEKQALAYVQAHAMQLQVQAQVLAYKHALQWLHKQNPAPLAHSIELNDDAVTVAKLGPAAK